MIPFNIALSVFNDNFSDAPGSVTVNNVSFATFPKLPIELRLKIWKECFPQNRFISVRITCTNNQPSSDLPESTSSTSEPQANRNSFGKIISRYPYHLEVAGFEQWSNYLLKVNRESHRAFHEFYRLSIPLGRGDCRRLHLNPEADILEVRRAQSGNSAAIVAFFQDVVAYDPLGVGIAHLAMGLNVNDLPHLSELKPSEMDPSTVEAITKLLGSSLQTFYACISPSVGARNMLGMLSWLHGPIYQNRAVPLAASGRLRQAPSFTLLQQDPRPIEDDLTQIAYLTDPRRRIFFWHKFMAKFGVSTQRASRPSMKIQYLYGIWHSPSDAGMDKKIGFVEYVNRLDEGWIKFMRDLNQPLWGDRVTEEEYHKHVRELQVVAGVWVFDEDAFGHIPDPSTHDDSTLMAYKKVKDMTASWPKLMVFHLSDRR